MEEEIVNGLSEAEGTTRFVLTLVLISIISCCVGGLLAILFWEKIYPILYHYFI